MNHILHHAAVLDGKLHHGTRELGRADDLGLQEGLLDMVDARDIGEVLRASHADLRAVRQEDMVVHARARGDEVEVELALQALLHDLHVE